MPAGGRQDRAIFTTTKSMAADNPKNKIGENEQVQRVLRQREEELEDEINDTFSSIAAILEERRKDVLAQLRSRVNGKISKLGNNICLTSNLNEGKMI